MKYKILFVTASLLFSSYAFADGNSVDKVYHPYVLPMETEVEWRSVIQKDNNPSLDNLQVHRLGIGRSFYENWFTEIYIIGEKTATDDFDTNKVELEAIVQLTEQGEYAADWGVLIEFARDFENNIGELAAGLLIEKEWGRLVGTLNLVAEYEWRESLNNEFETRASSQLRYRYNRLFEPAVELYTNQDTIALGPVIMGNIHAGIAKKIHWELGVIVGIDDSTPDKTYRVLIEYEF